MPDGPGGFTQDYSCPALLRIPLRFNALRVRSCHALWPSFPEHSARAISCDVVVLLPHRCRDTGGLGSSPFARHYWGNHVCFLFLRVLRCFSSPRWPPTSVSARWVVPFGNPRVKGHLRLTAAYRSLSRPSSPPGAKASTRCPSLLFCRLTVTQRDGLILSAFVYLPKLYCSCATCHRSYGTSPRPCRGKDRLRPSSCS